MATIKSFTDLEQSKKLAEILPLESADMFYCYGMDIDSKKWDYDTVPTIIDADNQTDIGDILCWSLTALFGVLPFVDFTMPQLIGTPKTLYRCMYNDNLKSHAHDNPIDACYEMILKLNELNLL